MSHKSYRIESLYKILEQEKASGFRDTIVIGGLDLFLQRWADDLKPILGEFGSYSILTPLQRKNWAEKVFDYRISRDLSSTGDKSVRVKSSPCGSSKKIGKSNKSIAPIVLSDEVTRLNGVSPRNISKFNRLGVEKVNDLIHLFPRRHNDLANVCKISELELGVEQTVIVNVWEASETRHKTNRRSTQATLGDDTGNVRAVWFNQPYLARTFKTGAKLVISGKVNVYRGSFVFESPEYELLQGQEELLHTGRLVPVYPTVDGLAQRTLRRIVKQALDSGVSQLTDFLPNDIKHRNGLMSLQHAVLQAHYPDSKDDWNAARRRLAFDELFTLQLAVLKRKYLWQEQELGYSLKTDIEDLRIFFSSLSFKFTAAQSRVLNEILDDLKQNRPMSRLLEGDVGSGKTVVAVAALLVAVLNGYQGTLMAPTEILAEQHFLTISNLFSGITDFVKDDYLISMKLFESKPLVTVGLLLGSMSKKAKTNMHNQISTGEIDLVIGTQALIQDEVQLPKLALAVVDEQHRFGVMQRASMRGKGEQPHLLAMSATPIPRSLALTVYGDLDISTIDEFPPGRQQIRTRWVQPDRRMAAYGLIAKQVEEERQAFIVCPLIDESETLQTRAATEEYHRLSKEVFPTLRLGLLHGRMSLREKEEVMDMFKRKDLDVLVSTPVVEVGIDVPNATVMLIDGADRFGLAQLHQFRGRVGRGEHQSYCLLLADSPGKEARERLKVMERVKDGFELAEADLHLRGPGDFLNSGTSQSGLPNLNVARITDHEILSLARQDADRLLQADLNFKKQEHILLAEHMKEFMSEFTYETS